MDYQHYFNQKFVFFIVLFVLVSLAVLYFWLDKSYMDNSPFLKKNPNVQVIIRLGLTAFVGIYAIMFVLRFVKDKKAIDANDYDVVSGIATYGIMDGGLLGLSKTIIIKVDDKEYEFRVAWADDISKGDSVKATYLPHSKYAIIENIE